MSCNLNSGGDRRRRTCTDLKHVEDKQTRARLPRGAGVRQGGKRTLVRVNEGGRRPERAGRIQIMYLNSADSSSLPESCSRN